MSNLTDALIAAKLVGGSGGSGGGSGLPEITRVTTELINETIPFEAEDTYYIGVARAYFKYIAGQTYTIIWDNVSYDCVCYEIPEEGIVAVGNASIIDAGEDTGEPFLSSTPVGDDMVTFMTANTAATHDCVIKSTAQMPPDGSILAVWGGEWTANPIEFVKTVNCESSASITVQAGAITEVLLREIPALDHSYAAIRIVKIAEGAIPLIVLDGTFKSDTAVLKVYNPTTESVYFGRNTKVSITGIMNRL